MDQSFVGLYHRLYNFIMKCVATYAMKTVTLGHGSHQSSTQLPSSSAASISSSMADQATHPMAQETPPKDASLQAEIEPDPAHNQKEVQEMGDTNISSAPSKEEKAAVSTIGPQAQPPKKMVSTNDTLDEITLTARRKKSKAKKRTEKMGSFDQEIDEPKPLKSIKKVGSKLDENSYMNSSSLESN